MTPKFAPCPRCGARSFSEQRFRDAHVSICEVPPTEYTRINGKTDALDHPERIVPIDIFTKT